MRKFIVQWAFRTTQLVIRALPNFRGKTRMARIILWPFVERYKPVRVCDMFGNALLVPSLKEPIALGLFTFGVYEPDTLASILAHIGSTGTYIDVGANVGAIALPVASQRPGARIIAVEADPAIAAILRRNAIWNKRSNVTIIECVVGAVNCFEVPFYSAPAEKFGMGSVGPQFGSSPRMLLQRTLDQVLDELAIDDVDIVKLDVEGSELGVLRGLAKRLHSLRPPTIIFEFADWAEARIEGQAAGDAQDFLLSIGYQLFHLTGTGTPGEALRHSLTTGTAMILALPAASVLMG